MEQDRVLLHFLRDIITPVMRCLSSFRRWFGKLAKSRHASVLVAVFVLIIFVGLAGPAHLILAENAADQISIGNTAAANLILFITSFTQHITGALAKLIIVIIEMLIVPILQYNSFSLSPTIGIGWSLVRDVVNMFVVLVLLVVAIGTIVGYEKISWQKNLPQFLLAVVLVNFSRTICGVLIDLSQVVMFTFVNALLDVAAGNFAELFDLNFYGEYSSSAVRDSNGVAMPIDAGLQLGAAYLQFILYACILAVMLLLAFVYLWRIILLWVLVILSPLTFFTWGLGSMFKFAAGNSGEWWKKFTAALVIGPTLTFFLWLALSTASGDIVGSEGFVKPDSAVSVTLSSFETSNLLATFLALCLLVVGMQQSASAASSMGGLAKKALGDEKLAQKLVGGAVGFFGGYSAARGAARATSKTAGVGIAAGKAMGTNIPGWLGGGVLGRTVVDSFGAVQQRADKYKKTGRAASRERIKEMTDEQKAAHIAMIAAGRTTAFGVGTMDDIDAMQTEVATNAALRKKNAASSPDLNDSINQAALLHAESVKDSFDDGQKEKYLKFKTEMAHVVARVLGAAELSKLVEDVKFNPRDLSKAALEDPAVIAALKKKVVKTTDDGKAINAYEEMLRGAYGEELKGAAKAGSVPKVHDQVSAASDPGKPILTAINPATGAAYSTKDIVGNIAAKRIKVDSLSVSELTGPNADNLIRGLLETEQEPTTIIDPAGRAAYLARAESLSNTAGALTPRQAAFIDSLRLDAGALPLDVFYPTASGLMDEQRMIGVLKRDAEYAGKLRGVVVSGTAFAEPAQDAIVDALTSKQVEDLEKEFRTTTDPARTTAIADAVEAISRSIEGFIARSLVPTGGRIKDIDPELDGVYKRVRRAARAMASAGVVPPPPNL